MDLDKSTKIISYDPTRMTFDDGHHEGYPYLFQRWRPKTLEEAQKSYDDWRGLVSSYLEEIDREILDNMKKASQKFHHA